MCKPRRLGEIATPLLEIQAKSTPERGSVRVWLPLSATTVRMAQQDWVP